MPDDKSLTSTLTSLRASRRLRRWLAAASPLWVAACGPSAPPLSFGAPGLAPTLVPVRVTISARSKGTSCSTRLSALTLVQASCGEGCTAVDKGTDEDGVSLVLELTASTPGTKRLDVVVDDAEVGRRAESGEIEFADVDRVTAIHDARRDPGAALPTLVGFEHHYCVEAFAADKRRIDIWASPAHFESLTPALSTPGLYAELNGPCWMPVSAERGAGHIRIEAAGRAVEHFPEVIAESDVAEIHLHRERLPDAVWLPLDEAGNPDGDEVTRLVATDGELWVELVARLVTKDGRVARAPGTWFHADHKALTIDENRSGGHRFSVGAVPGERTPATCLRATIGEAHLDVPVYLDVQPGSTTDPCLVEVPSVSGDGGAPGEGGAGGEAGAGGEGGAGGPTRHP